MHIVHTIGTVVYEDDWQIIIKKVKPQIIQAVGFDFGFDPRDVWKLNAPIVEIDVKELLWHLNVPFLWENGGYYNLKPQDVLDHPASHQYEYERVMQADLSYPIDVMENKGKLTILDGLHRLLRAVVLGHTAIKGRIHSRNQISKIASIDS